MDMRNVPQLPQIRTDPHPLGGRRRSRRRADIPVPTATEVLRDSPLKSFVTNDTTFAEFEADLIRMRTRECMAIAKTKG